MAGIQRYDRLTALGMWCDTYCNMLLMGLASKLTKLARYWNAKGLMLRSDSFAGVPPKAGVRAVIVSV